MPKLPTLDSLFSADLLSEWDKLPFSETPLLTWLCLPVLLAGAYFVAKLATGLSRRVMRRKFKPGGPTFGACLAGHPLREPLTLLLTIMLFSYFREYLPTGKDTARTLLTLEKILSIFGGIWLLFTTLDCFARWLETYFQMHQRPGASTALPLIRRTLKFLVVVIGMLFLLQNFGINVSALLAGLGIGGIAIALAGQKTVEQLFGGISLVLDQPVKVGDNFKAGGVTGIVEDIGMRSTRVRTPDRTIVSIPNAEFVNLKIENMTPRDRWHLQQALTITHATPPDELKEIMTRIVEVLKEPKPYRESSASCLLKAISDAGLTIEFQADYQCASGGEFDQLKQDRLLSILALLQHHGAAFAHPNALLATYLASMPQNQGGDS